MTVPASYSRRAKVAVCSAVLSVATFTSSLQSQAKSFKHPDGTTHWYEAVAAKTPGIDWSAAHLAAAAAGGYLATITSQAESDVVFGLIDDANYWSGGIGPWFGGTQQAGSVEPAGGWKWVESESFTYQNWATAKPDNRGNADATFFYSPAGARAATWSDGNKVTSRPGYVIEYAGTMVPLTVGLQLRESGSFDGYTLINPQWSTRTLLVDSRGRVVHDWVGQNLQTVVYLEPNGHLLRGSYLGNRSFPGGGSAGLLEEYDWQGNVVWDFRYSTRDVCFHHDVARLPNGNILMIAWEWMSKQAAIDAGRDPSLLIDGELWPDKIIEVQPMSTGGKIVWEWRVMDHLVQDFDQTKANFGNVAQHPALVDLNYTHRTPRGHGVADWMHLNAVDYNAKLDQIMLGVRTFDELWVIDHSTTTAEAASHSGGRSGKGGDLLYRWGNPRAYRAGTAADQTLFKQHDTQWIPDKLPGAGRILVFNNGLGRGYSSVDEIVPPTVDARGNYPRSGAAWGPKSATWSYTAPGLYSRFVSSAQRLPNGNTLICEGPYGRVLEVTNAGAQVWQYTCPVGISGPFKQGDAPAGTNLMFRSRRYAPDDPAFTNRNLTPGEPYEIYDSILLADGSPVSRRARIGTTVALSLQSAAAAASGSKPYYQIGTSASKGLVPIDDRFARMGVDALLLMSLSNTNPTVFRNYFGRLDVKGRGRAAIIIPNMPVLSGLDLQTAFLVTDLAAPSTVGMISNTVEVRIR